MSEQRPNNRVSMGRNFNHEPTCGTCPHLKRDGNRWGGWCQHPANRVFAHGWPQGFTPSMANDGGCDLHPLTAATGVPQP
jgi:hypothetical protein